MRGFQRDNDKCDKSWIQGVIKPRVNPSKVSKLNCLLFTRYHQQTPYLILTHLCHPRPTKKNSHRNFGVYWCNAHAYAGLTERRMTSKIGTDFLMSTRAGVATGIKRLAVVQGSPHNHSQQEQQFQSICLVLILHSLLVQLSCETVCFTPILLVFRAYFSPRW